MWFEHLIVSRPYELVYLFMYLILMFLIYPKVYKAYPYILTNCIFYMAVTQVVIALYLMVLSSSPYDSGYNIAYFLKILFYFIPFACFIINYVYSYNAVLEAQGKLRLSQEKLKYMASHDALTDLYNRREFEILLSKAISNSNRDNYQFGLFVIDIDNFKTINDTLGHIQGDAFLKQFSDKLEKLTREGDVVSRIGGDEYALITSRINSPTNVRKLAERMVEKLSEPIPVSGKLIKNSISLGIAICPQDGTTTESLFKNADIAMYSAKKSGKNTYRFYEEQFSEKQQKEAQIENELKDAIDKGELHLFFQPKYCLDTHEVLGAEILLRWHNKKLGDLPAEVFIEVAENTGLIVKIGEWVLQSTCDLAKRWLEKYPNKLVYSINVLNRQFEDNLFVDKLEEVIKKTPFPAERLELEIPELLLMNKRIDVDYELERISQLGVSLAIDDYGMGYSSLSRLKKLPIKTIKIDKSFISEIQSKNKKVPVIDTIIKLSSGLDLNIVAEGIETEVQKDYLLKNGCRVGQGYLLSKPLSAKDFENQVLQNQ